jgi:GcrA cell cycle regulator
MANCAQRTARRLFDRIPMTKKQKTISTIEQSDCRWPVGDPRHAEFHFCGARQLAGRPYCELHWSMAFQPSKPRNAQSPAILLTRRAA